MPIHFSGGSLENNTRLDGLPCVHSFFLHDLPGLGRDWMVAVDCCYCNGQLPEGKWKGKHGWLWCSSDTTSVLFTLWCRKTKTSTCLICHKNNLVPAFIHAKEAKTGSLTWVAQVDRAIDSFSQEAPHGVAMGCTMSLEIWLCLQYSVKLNKMLDKQAI